MGLQEFATSSQAMLQSKSDRTSLTFIIYDAAMLLRNSLVRLSTI